MRAFKILFIYLLFFLCSCDNDPDPPIELQLPPITTTGAGTFGCLVNGEVWLPDSDKNSSLNRQLFAKYNEQTHGLIIGADYIKVDQNIEQSMIIYAEIQIIGEYPLNSGSNIFYNVFDSCTTYLYEPGLLNEITISRIDVVNDIVSGTFDMTGISEECGDTIYIRDGRFDLNYTL